MRGSMSKENAEKMLRGQCLKEAKLDFESNVTLEKGNYREKYIVSVFG